jgi:hypothetical protein
MPPAIIRFHDARGSHAARAFLEMPERATR